MTVFGHPIIEVEKHDTGFKLPTNYECDDAVTLAELALKFFRFYGYEFDFKKHVISINEASHGTRLLKPTRPGRQPTSWQIRDPWEARDNLACRMTRSSRDLIIEGFRAAEWVLWNTGDWYQITKGSVPSRRLFVSFVTRSVDSNQSMATNLIRMLKDKSCEPLRVYTCNDSCPRVTNFIEFQDEASVALCMDLCLKIVSSSDQVPSWGPLKFQKTCGFTITVGHEGGSYQVTNAEGVVDVHREAVPKTKIYAEYVVAYRCSMEMSSLWGVPPKRNWPELPPVETFETFTRSTPHEQTVTATDHPNPNEDYTSELVFVDEKFGPYNYAFGPMHWRSLTVPRIPAGVADKDILVEGVGRGAEEDNVAAVTNQMNRVIDRVVPSPPPGLESSTPGHERPGMSAPWWSGTPTVDRVVQSMVVGATNEVVRTTSYRRRMEVDDVEERTGESEEPREDKVYYGVVFDLAYNDIALVQGIDLMSLTSKRGTASLFVPRTVHVDGSQ